MGLIDPHLPDDQIAGQDKRQIDRDRAEATEFDRVNFFGSRSTYNGSKAALARLRARRAADAILPPD